MTKLTLILVLLMGVFAKSYACSMDYFPVTNNSNHEITLSGLYTWKTVIEPHESYTIDGHLVPYTYQIHDSQGIAGEISVFVGQDDDIGAQLIVIRYPAVVSTSTEACISFIYDDSK